MLQLIDASTNNFRFNLSMDFLERMQLPRSQTHALDAVVLSAMFSNRWWRVNLDGLAASLVVLRLSQLATIHEMLVTEARSFLSGQGSTPLERLLQTRCRRYLRVTPEGR
jgi:hypothetical protein